MEVEVDVGEGLRVRSARRNHVLRLRLGLTGEFVIGVVAIAVHEYPCDMGRARGDVRRLRHALRACRRNDGGNGDDDELTCTHQRLHSVRVQRKWYRIRVSAPTTMTTSVVISFEQ